MLHLSHCSFNFFLLFVFNFWETVFNYEQVILSKFYLKVAAQLFSFREKVFNYGQVIYQIGIYDKVTAQFIFSVKQYLIMD